MDEPARAQLLHQHFKVLTQTIFDRFWALRASDEGLAKNLLIEGEHHLSALSAARVGIIFVPHFVAIDLALRLSVKLGKGNYHYANLHNEKANRWINQLRRRLGGEPFSLNVKNLRRLRRQGGLLYYSPDMDFRQRADTVFVPFLGVSETATLAVLPRLARVLDAAVIACVPILSKNGYVLRVYPLSNDFLHSDAKRAARAMNDFLGKVIRQYPEQYYWLHRRFKTGVGNTDYYAQAE